MSTSMNRRAENQVDKPTNQYYSQVSMKTLSKCVLGADKN